MRHMFGLLLLLAAPLSVAAPPTQVADADSSPKLDLDAYRGKVVYLDFWASWCAPCRRSFPWMNSMMARYGDKGLAIVSVNVDAERELAFEFLSETPADFPVIYDPEGKLASQWELLGMPASFVIDRSGNLVSRHVGFRSVSPQKYEAELRHLLEQAEEN